MLSIDWFLIAALIVMFLLFAAGVYCLIKHTEERDKKLHRVFEEFQKKLHGDEKEGKE